MKYKQKLATHEAFHYTGNYGELCAWYLSESVRSLLPFYWAGRELQTMYSPLGGNPISIKPGCYVVLLPDKVSIRIESQEEFESAHVIPKEVK